jgi:hypothetical protein
MWEVSRGLTMACNSMIVKHEVATALSRRFPHVRPPVLELIGSGVGHAFGQPGPQYRIPAAIRSRLPAVRAQDFESYLNLIIERACITGESPDGTPPPVFTNRQHGEDFAKYLRGLGTRLRQLPRVKYPDALNAISMCDNLEAFHWALAHTGITWARFLALGREELTRFQTELPSRVVESHLRWQYVKNPSLQPRANDLEDWSGLISAAAYCDFVVCEKHFASLARRDGFRPKARVLTDLSDLPRLAA